MNDFKLKLILTILTGVVFSFIFILLALVLPAGNDENIVIKKPRGLLEQVSESIK
jgi:hypothetical protein